MALSRDLVHSDALGFGSHGPGAQANAQEKAVRKVRAVRGSSMKLANSGLQLWINSMLAG